MKQVTMMTFDDKNILNYEKKNISLKTVFILIKLIISEIKKFLSFSWNGPGKLQIKYFKILS